MLLDGNYETYTNLMVGNKIQLEWEHTHCNLDRGIRPVGYLVKKVDDLHYCILCCIQAHIHGYMLLLNLVNGQIDKIFSVENDVITKEHSIPSEFVIFDISSHGERWEGSVDSDGFEGWGRLYDKYGNLEYEGFLFLGMKMGYGIQYYPELGTPYYQGTFVNDECIGFGTSYSREGHIIHQGAFPYQALELVVKPEVQLICNQITSLVIEPELEIETLDLNLFPCLCELRCTEKSLPRIRSIVAIGQNSINRVTLLDRSCCSEYVDKGVNGSVRFQNCKSLRVVEIGAYCLRRTKSVCISSCSSLVTLLLGEFSFNNAEEFVLRGRVGVEIDKFLDCPCLTSLEFAFSSFFKGRKVLIWSPRCFPHIYA